MASVPADLLAFLAEHRDSREYRRGLAVKLALEGYTYETISSILGCTPGFVSQVKKAYAMAGVDGLVLKYRGAQPFLSAEERTAVIAWLKDQQEWSPQGLREYVEQSYGVVFQSDQSYYELLAEAKITYKKAQAHNPKRDDERVAAKKKSSKR